MATKRLKLIQEINFSFVPFVFILLLLVLCEFRSVLFCFSDVPHPFTNFKLNDCKEELIV